MLEISSKYSHSRIKHLVRDIAAQTGAAHSLSEDHRQLLTSDLEINSIVGKTLRYYSEKDGLRLVAADKDVMGDCVSALFPLANKIAVLREEYQQIVSSDGFWLPVIIAHELGHWALHAPSFRRFRRQLDLFSHETRIGSTFAEIKQVDHSQIDFLDQQANLFARELLLPDENIRTALLQMGYYPPIIYKEHHLNLMPFEEYATRLAEKIHPILQAPLQLLRFRLTELHLLQSRVPDQLGMSS